MIVAGNTAIVGLAAAMAGNGAAGVVLTAGVYLLLQGVSVLGVVSEQRHKAARLQLAQAHTELRATTALLDVSSRTAERLRISRDLHDVIGHQVTALALELEVASHHAQPPASAHVARARSIAKDLLTDLRATVGALRDTVPELAPALEAVTADLPSPRVHLQVEEGAMVGEDRRTAVVRCVQEIVTNAIRHSDADNLWIDVTVDGDGRLVLSAHDDGRGARDLAAGQRADGPARAGRGARRPGQVQRRRRVLRRRDGAGAVIRVLVVDDQTLVRQGIRSLLELADNVTVVAEADDGDAALEAVEAHHPDVVLLDLRMPGRDGIATMAALRDRGVEVPVLVLTTFDDDDLVLQAIRAGARGYLLKDVTLEQLVGAVRTLAAGQTLVQPAITDRLLRAARGLGTSAGKEGPMTAPVDPLTPRELEVLRLLASGYANREIATALHLAEGTVKNHVSNVLLKLGVRDRTRAVMRALHLGLLGDPDR